MSGDMVARYLPLNLVSIHLMASEKTMSADGRTDGRTTNAHVITVPLLCSSTKQS